MLLSPEGILFYRLPTPMILSARISVPVPAVVGMGEFTQRTQIYRTYRRLDAYTYEQVGD